MRQVMSELRALEETGYFEGLTDLIPGSAEAGEPKFGAGRGSVPSQMRLNLLSRRIATLKPMDHPVGPALSQFMTQVSVRERTDTYKQETHRKFADGVGQVRILFGKIARGEVSSNSIVRSVAGSFMDTFMRDRNLLVNLSTTTSSVQDYLYDHSLKLCLLSLSLASAAGYSRSQSLEIAQGALLADIGMMLVPEKIRLKRGRLTKEESDEVKKHPLLGLSLLEPIHGLSEPVLLVPYQHHERISGDGYPDRRSGNLVSRFSRIVSIADVYTALINKRSYREALIPYQAMVAILSMGGQGKLDGEQVKHFLKTVSIFPLGSLVRLSTGQVAKVVDPNPVEYTKPIVSVLTSEDGAPLRNEAIFQINLVHSDVKITEALAGQAINHHVLDGF